MQKLRRNFFYIIFIILHLNFFCLKAFIFDESPVTTLSLISDYVYPSETHKVTTEDNYIVTMFRIPYSPKNITNSKETSRPVVFLLHGFIESSSDWVLNGYPRSLGFYLSDAGYDVWLGNSRGTRYSKQHKYLSTLDPAFWDFSWHEMGIFDLPACVDYILKNTSNTKLQYIGHSQGTTAFLVAVSSLPKFNDKIQSAYLLAPVAFISDTTAFGLFRPILVLTSGQPTQLKWGAFELLPSSDILQTIAKFVCNTFLLKFICKEISYIQFGQNSKHTNSSALAIFYQTVPAGFSTKQIFHYTQLIDSQKFCQFDYGHIENLRFYKQAYPPDYELKNIKTPLYIYHSENDVLADPPDVRKLISELPSNVLKKTYKMPYKTWNHGDFILANNVDEILYSMVLEDLKAGAEL